MAYGLVVVGDMQLGEVFLDASGFLATMPQTGFHDRHLLWEGRCLFEVCHAQVSAEHHGSRLGFFLARDDVEE